MSNRKYKETIDITHPKIASEWHPTLNGDKRASDYTHGSNKKFWWLCPKCKEEYDAQINARCKGSNCPFCARQKVNNENCFAITHSELAKQWYQKKNGNTTPYDVLSGSNVRFWWKCPKCNSDYETEISSRTHGKNCPYCAGKLVNKTNCLSTTHPVIVKDWHPTLNKEKLPCNYTAGQSTIIWWKCSKCRSDYDAKIIKRTIGQGCSYCAGKKVNNTNCLAVLYPELATEWHNTKNGNTTPYDVLCGSNKTYWWQCAECKKEYDTTPGHRVYSNRGCPFCPLGKNEKITGQVIKELLPNIEIIHQYKIQILDHHYTIDYYFEITNQKYYIEYNGRQHYQPTQFGNQKIENAKFAFEIQSKRDSLIREYCINNNISLIEIDGRKYFGKNIIRNFLKEILKNENIDSSRIAPKGK